MSTIYDIKQALVSIPNQQTNLYIKIGDLIYLVTDDVCYKDEKVYTTVHCVGKEEL